ncbi:TPA: hypothetical protein U1B14_001572 [Streptococcus suis]|uniref:hypothetical protein n=1 Tax=Streptococcus phage phiNJ2 TaxID=1239381 RepID=UPI00028A6386|nr:MULTISPECIES: hypothetical protein [Streptococcus]YP_006990332.1 hypothetical protein phiNJ2_0013 [Streptococcus phage phiNJ2]AFU88673.1 hypothetical protein phiNJ2_0013 [Streptococcus phage phiNJ2]MBS8093957.1 hypothetical protein [Streptococcus suis]MBY0752417.1 hypothetical protein [Streptococcus sp. 2018037]MCO8189649.1 hypothetical protein [Streptococcus suis]MCO8207668.1 hypothetical protein [Streptococcus suis]
MANTFNLLGNDESIIFNIGELSLKFVPTDAKSQEVSEKAIELQTKADNIKEGDEWENRKNIKELLDEYFSTMFDADAPAKIYQEASENTWAYLKVFLQISEAIMETKKKQENDETFKKYLAE